VNHEPVSAIILAGGQSTRLGRDKASELLLGRSLLQRVVDRLDGLVDEFVIVRATGQALPPIASTVPLRVVEDDFPRIGPLGGVYSGLSATKEPRAITVACDMPLVVGALLAELLRRAPGHDAVVPVNGQPEPLCAVYAMSCITAMKARIDAGEYKVTAFLETIDVLYVEPEEWRRFDPEGLSFLNINRDADLRRAEHLLARADGERRTEN
jgi:molybdopterin-guanine dinucleotide biosynthesis protein A